MNTKLLLKSLLIVVVLALLVLMGMNNTGRVDFALPPLLPKRIQLPAALMYFACFAVGFLTGTLLWAGGGKRAVPSGARSGGIANSPAAESAHDTASTRDRPGNMPADGHGACWPVSRPWVPPSPRRWMAGWRTSRLTRPRPGGPPSAPGGFHLLLGGRSGAGLGTGGGIRAETGHRCPRWNGAPERPGIGPRATGNEGQCRARRMPGVRWCR